MLDFYKDEEWNFFLKSLGPPSVAHLACVSLKPLFPGTILHISLVCVESSKKSQTLIRNIFGSFSLKDNSNIVIKEGIHSSLGRIRSVELVLNF